MCLNLLAIFWCQLTYKRTKLCLLCNLSLQYTIKSFMTMFYANISALVTNPCLLMYYSVTTGNMTMVYGSKTAFMISLRISYQPVLLKTLGLL